MANRLKTYFNMTTISLVFMFIAVSAILWMDACLYWHIQNMPTSGDDLASPDGQLAEHQDTIIAINHHQRESKVHIDGHTPLTNYLRPPFFYDPFRGLSIKLMMTDPIDNYLFAPMAETFVQLTQFNRYFFWITPNMISYAGVGAALVAAKLVSAPLRPSHHLLSVFAFQLRTWLDALDGIVARSRLGIHKHMSLNSTPGYVIDGVCDAIGFVAYLVGCYLFLRYHYARHHRSKLPSTCAQSYPLAVSTDQNQIQCSECHNLTSETSLVVRHHQQQQEHEKNVSSTVTQSDRHLTSDCDVKCDYVPLYTHDHSISDTDDNDDNDNDRPADEPKRKLNQKFAIQTVGNILARQPSMIVSYYIHDLKRKHTRTILTVIVCFIVQVAMVSAAWNRYIILYRSLLESVSASDQEALLKNTILRSNVMWILIWFWRLNNGHSMMHMLTISVLFSKLWKFLTFIKYIGFVEIITLTVVTEMHARDTQYILNALNQG